MHFEVVKLQLCLQSTNNQSKLQPRNNEAGDYIFQTFFDVQLLTVVTIKTHVSNSFKPGFDITSKL